VLGKLGVIGPSTKLAGCSSGAIISTSHCAGVPTATVYEAGQELAHSCRSHLSCSGTLDKALRKVLDDTLPNGEPYSVYHAKACTAKTQQQYMQPVLPNSSVITLTPPAPSSVPLDGHCVPRAGVAPPASNTPTPRCCPLYYPVFHFPTCSSMPLLHPGMCYPCCLTQTPTSAAATRAS
jgi:hypothetical protein